MRDRACCRRLLARVLIRLSSTVTARPVKPRLRPENPTTASKTAAHRAPPRYTGHTCNTSGGDVRQAGVPSSGCGTGRNVTPPVSDQHIPPPAVQERPPGDEVRNVDGATVTAHQRRLGVASRACAAGGRDTKVLPRRPPATLPSTHVAGTRSTRARRSSP